MKEVKERFSRWYNQNHDRKGAVWMNRFKSVMVEDGNALRTMSAYIDLNAVRAGIVDDPKDYRWCGYAEAVAGSKVARYGLCEVMQQPRESWMDREVEKVNPETEKRETVVKRGSGGWYRCWLMRDGKEVDVDEKSQQYGVKAKNGIPKEIAEDSLAREGVLTMPEILRTKIRYFTEGIALGGQEFVEEWYEKNRIHYSPAREKGAKQVPLKMILANLPKQTGNQTGSVEPRKADNPSRQNLQTPEKMQNDITELKIFDEQMLDWDIQEILSNLHTLKGVLPIANLIESP